MKQTSQNWYVRRGGKTLGPFPAGLVSRYVLLGRIGLDDLLSTNREEWRPLRELTELIPEVLLQANAHPEDPEASARLEAARRWADERRNPHPVPLAGDERRQGESIEELSLREARAGRSAASARSSAKAYLGVAAVIAIIVAIPFLFPSQRTSPGPDCTASPGPGIDWSHCRLPGRDLANADLSGSRLDSADLSAAVLRAANLRQGQLAYVNFAFANLRGANLAGASLKGANLRSASLLDADLRGADLSYAILTGADLQGAQLAETRLDNAQWVDGAVCLPGSVGECRLVR